MRTLQLNQVNVKDLALIGLALLSLGLILYRPKGEPCPPPVFVPHGREYHYAPDAGWAAPGVNTLSTTKRFG